MVQAAHHAAMRVYELDDLVGAEVGGAVKNIMAVATGICDGMQLGLNARAALITRGMAEIKRLAVAGTWRAARRSLDQTSPWLSTPDHLFDSEVSSRQIG